MMAVTKKLAVEVLEFAEDVFTLQDTAKPCVYLYNEEVCFSRGDTLGGIDSVVYEGKEDRILLDTEDLLEAYHISVNEEEAYSIGYIHEKLKSGLS